MSRPPSPLWKQVFDSVEARIAPVVDDLMKRDDVVTAVVLAQRTRGEVDRRVERASRRVLHLLNLPAGSDVNRLLAHIARLEREVGELRNELADRENAELLAELSARHATGTARKQTARKQTARKRTAQAKEGGGGHGDRSGDAARTDPT